MRTTKKKIEEYTEKYSKICRENGLIDRELYDKYGVKRGLRDKSGKGVLTGLTNISAIEARKEVNGEIIPTEGNLYYRGYNIFDLIEGIENRGNRDGFEEMTYLLLFGNLPTKDELAEFKEVLANFRNLPKNFVKDVIMKAPTKDIMNSMTSSVLTLASYDKRASDLSLENVLRQSLMLIATFPMLAVYGYHAYNHYELGTVLYPPTGQNLTAAENILRMLRPNKEFTELEAKVLDTALVLHMEHGGGTTPTFTTRVVTSSGSDTYSVIAAALSSLKGPKHGAPTLKLLK